MLLLKAPYKRLHFINILLSPNICTFSDAELFLHPYAIEQWSSDWPAPVTGQIQWLASSQCIPNGKKSEGGRPLDQVSNLIQWPTTLNLNQFCISQREATHTRREPFSGLSVGMSSFSERHRGWEKDQIGRPLDQVAGHWIKDRILIQWPATPKKQELHEIEEWNIITWKLISRAFRWCMFHSSISCSSWAKWKRVCSSHRREE